MFFNERKEIQPSVILIFYFNKFYFKKKKKNLIQNKLEICGICFKNQKRNEEKNDLELKSAFKDYKSTTYKFKMKFDTF